VNRKRLKTLNLCDRSVEVLQKQGRNGSEYARTAILQHEALIKRRNEAISQAGRDEDALRFLCDVIRMVYLYPNEAEDRINAAFEFDDEIQDWYRRDELEGKGLTWFLHRTRYVASSTL
jgi:hypothetical protein